MEKKAQWFFRLFCHWTADGPFFGIGRHKHGSINIFEWLWFAVLWNNKRKYQRWLRCDVMSITFLAFRYTFSVDIWRWLQTNTETKIITLSLFQAFNWQLCIKCITFLMGTGFYFSLAEKNSHWFIKISNGPVFGYKM